MEDIENLEIEEMDIKDLEDSTIVEEVAEDDNEDPYAFTATMMDLNYLKELYRDKIKNYLARQAKESYAYTADEITDLLCFNSFTGTTILSVLPSFIYCTYITEDWTKRVDDLLDQLTEFYDNHLSSGGSFQEYLNKTLKKLDIKLSNIDQTGDIAEQFKEVWIDEAKGI